MKKTEPPKKNGAAIQRTVDRPPTPEEYRRVLEGIQLKDISLEECLAKVNRDKLVEPISVEVKWETSYKESSRNNIAIFNKYQLIAKVETDDEFALKIMCTFKLLYSSENRLSKKFVDIFAARNSSLNTWPYFREFTQSAVQKMNLPSLVLPLLKLGPHM